MVGKTTFTYPLEYQEGISETAFVVSPLGEVIICKGMNFCGTSPSHSLETSLLNFTNEETAHGCSIEETVELDDEASVGNDDEIDDFYITIQEMLILPKVESTLKFILLILPKLKIWFEW